MSDYIHGVAPEEQSRLSLLNDLMNAACLREMRLQGGETILDMGSGLGQFSRLMARTVGATGRVVGVEVSEAQIAEAREKAQQDGEATLVEFRQGDALHPPLKSPEWGRFDVVHTRFLLEHLSDPVSAVRQMAKAVKPGGRVILEDDPHDVLRLSPEPAGFHPLWQAYMRTYDRMGYDPLIGHRLVSLLHEAGLQPVRNAWIFFGACQGEPTFPAFVENLLGVITGARERTLSEGLLDAASFAEGIEGVERWSQRPDAALWYAIAFAEGRRKA